jgi:phosphotransferase system enzyme I (PtsI)
VGLFRSEFDFAAGRALPTEASLTASYASAAEAMAGKPVYVRLLEVDSTRAVGERVLQREPNPALGVRSLRFLLTEGRILPLQLRALVRAAASGRLGVMVPFVSSVDDYRDALAALAAARAEVEAEGGPGKPGALEVGLVVEVPGLLPVLDDLLSRERADFVAVAADNLTQYLAAADRTNGNTSRWFERCWPALFRTLRDVVDVAARRKKPLHVFGDAVADPAWTPLLLGLGVRRFGMSPISVPRVKTALLATTVRDAKARARRALGAVDAASFAAVLAEAVEAGRRA